MQKIAPINLLREKDSLLQKIGKFDFVKREHFTLKRRGAPRFSGGGIGQRLRKDIGMGQRMSDEPIVYGDDCLLGFPAGETPEHLYVRFSGIVKCPAGPIIFPNGRVFKFTQIPAPPCVWYYYGSVWEGFLQIHEFPLRVWLEMRNVATYDFYFLDINLGHIDEGTVYVNNNAVCDPDIGGAGGIASVTWIPQVTDLLEALVIEKSDDLFMELFPLEGDKFVYKFCRLKDATNIKVLYEPGA